MRRKSRIADRPWGNTRKAQRGEEPLSYNNRLFKHIPGSYVHPLQLSTEISAARQTPYYWWWRFLRISQDYPPTAERRDPLRSAMYEDFGELGTEFGDWWSERGRDLFAERGRLPLVRVLAAPGEIDITEGDMEIAIVIPLTINQDLILQQIQALLAGVHPGPSLMPDQFSTAKRRIYPKAKYNMTRYENMVDIVDEVRSNGEMDWAEIGADYGIYADRYHPLETEGRTQRKEKHEGQRKAVRSLYLKAINLAHNAALGVFPYETKQLTTQEASGLTGIPLPDTPQEET